MKFNKLYLHGFKSFVDKTTVDFPDGITAIVGPNGSGKSNIMDAVRWVFGEQNAKELRGADMEDIVFNGSQKRKPAGFAEVGLTLSDIDEAVASKYGTFSDITITRKFYKTGEREYYINNRKCRLKDIKDIFMDTGLGARSISIIEQGKVDKIINADPEELRFFLEETAGVTKFKDKKKEAERRLQQTRDNLDRVNDIIDEIVNQMQSLSSAVEQLKIYEDLQSKFKTLERSYLCTSYYVKAEDAGKLKSVFIEKKHRLEELLAEYAGIIRQESAANEEYNNKQSHYEILQERRVDISTKKTKTEGDIRSLETQIASSGSLKAALQENIKTEKSRLDDISEAIENLTDELDTARDALEFVNDKVEELSEVIDDLAGQKDTADDEFEETDSEYLKITENITNKRNELIRIETNFEHNKSTIDRLEREKAEISSIFVEAEQKKILSEEELVNIENMLEDKQTVYENLKEKNNILLDKYNSCKDEYNSIGAEIKSIESSIVFYENQLNAYSYAGEVDFLREYNAELLIDNLQSEDINKLSDIGDVFLFDDSKKEQILEKVNSLNISIRFTFKGEINKVKETIGRIGTAGTYNGIYVLDGIYKKSGDDDKGRQIVELKENIKKANEQVISLKDKHSSLHDNFLSLELELSAGRENEHEASVLYDEAKSLLVKKEAEIESIKNEYERVQKRVITVEKEIEMAKYSQSEAENKITVLREDINRFASKQMEFEDKRQLLEEKLINIKEELDDKKGEMTELKIQYAQKEEQLNSIKKELESNRKQKEEVKKNIESLTGRLEQLLNVDEKEWNNQLIEMRQKLDELVREVLSVEDEVKTALNQLEESRLYIDELRKQADKINEDIKGQDDEVRKLELDIAGITSVLDAACSQYFEKYNSELTHEYLTYADKEKEPRRLKEEMNRVERQLDDLGPINLNAVNDYREAEERYSFLTEQRSDLEESIDDINKFIYETDSATVRMFEETYNSVKDKFVEVFHILFGGGEAELRLSDPENLLTSGVEIYIQPPGKKLQHMGLLSGGEKALTAMTLLFALFLQKPTPFCFLDEVDAPLDDANVERYIGMVKALSDKTQFILITHNHNTMSIADSIYGVAMQEYGVSTILSVTLEQVNRAGR